MPPANTAECKCSELGTWRAEPTKLLASGTAPNRSRTSEKAFGGWKIKELGIDIEQLNGATDHADTVPNHAFGDGLPVQ